MADFRKNIPFLYIIKISKWFNLVMPVIVLFYQENGMGMSEIFLLKSIYSLSIVSLEIPSGWMADSWGRKKTLLIGSILGAIGFLIYSLTHGFWMFAIAEIVLGAGHSFVSGADSALLYDSLKSSGRSKDYLKHEGRVTSAGNFAEAFAGIVSGFLAAISLQTPFYFQFFVAASAIPASIMLIEPGIKVSKHLGSFKNRLKHIQLKLLGNENLRISIMLSATTGTATLTFAWLVQPFFQEINLPVKYFGMMWTLLNLTAGISSVYSHWFEKFFGRHFTFLLLIVLIFSGYLFTGFLMTWTGLIFLFYFYFIRGIAGPVFKNYINQFTESEMRATILSSRDFAIRINFAVIGPILGWITDYYSLKSAFLTAGIIYIVSTILIVKPWIIKFLQLKSK